MSVRTLFFRSPDVNAPTRYLAVLEVLALIGLLGSALDFIIAYVSSDFALLCCVAVPLGAAFLGADVLAYRAIRSRYPKGPLGRVGARFAANVIALTNAIPPLASAVALALGAALGPQNGWWLQDISLAVLILGSLAISLIFHPFNVVGLILGSALAIATRVVRAAPGGTTSQQ